MVFSQRLTVIYLILANSRIPAMPTSATDSQDSNVDISTKSPITTTIDYDLADFDEFANDPGLYDTAVGGLPKSSKLADDNNQGYSIQPQLETATSLLDSKKKVTSRPSNSQISSEVSDEDIQDTNLQRNLPQTNDNGDGTLQGNENGDGGDEDINVGNQITSATRVNSRSKNGKTGENKVTKGGSALQRKQTSATSNKADATETSNPNTLMQPENNQTTTVKKVNSETDVSNPSSSGKSGNVLKENHGTDSPSPDGPQSYQGSAQSDEQSGDSSQVATVSDENSKNTEQSKQSDTTSGETKSAAAGIDSSQSNDTAVSETSDTSEIDSESFSSNENTKSGTFSNSDIQSAENRNNPFRNHSNVQDTNSYLTTEKQSNDMDYDTDIDLDNSKTAPKDSLQTSDNKDRSNVDFSKQESRHFESSKPFADEDEETAAYGEYWEEVTSLRELSNCFVTSANESKTCSLIKALYSICSAQFRSECLVGNNQNRKSRPQDVGSSDHSLAEDASNFLDDDDDSTDSAHSGSDRSYLSAATVENLSASFEKATDILEVISLIREVCPSICLLAAAPNHLSGAIDQSGTTQSQYGKRHNAAYESSESEDDDILDFSSNTFSDSDEDVTENLGGAAMHLFSENIVPNDKNDPESVASNRNSAVDDQDSVMVTTDFSEGIFINSSADISYVESENQENYGGLSDSDGRSENNTS